MRQKSQDRSSSLQWLVNHGESEEGKVCKRYTIENLRVCREAFKTIFCVGNNRLDRINKLGNKDLGKPKSAGRPTSMRTLVLISWMKSFFQTRVETLPNKDIQHLPDNYSKKEVWKIYDSSLGEMDKTSKISYRAFTRVWDENFSHVKIPPVNHFSACADCEEFKSLRDQAITDYDKRKWCFNLFIHEIMKC